MKKIIGIVGFKNVGKTFIASQIITSLVSKGYKVGSIKHAHHTFDIDRPGTDSFKHRAAGSIQVVISSSKRWAKIVENYPKEEKKLGELIDEFVDIDIIVIEGFKKEDHPKILIADKDSKHIDLNIKNVIAMISDNMNNLDIPIFKKNNIENIVEFIIKKII